MMRWLPVAAAVLVLSGCAAPDPVPPGLTQGQVKALMADQETALWQALFPDEPQPVIDVVEYVPESSLASTLQRCLLDADLEGVDVSLGNSVSFASEDPGAGAAFDLQQYTCQAQYPVDMFDHPEDFGLFSEAQLQYLRDYYESRLEPCLALLGYEVATETDPAVVFSSPYFALVPSPQGSAEWERINAACPPPPIGPRY